VVHSDDEDSDEESESSAESSEEDSESEEEEPDDGKLYCLCKKPYDKWDFMIACDSCDDWFHVRCVGLTQAAAKRIKQYICPLCKKGGISLFHFFFFNRSCLLFSFFLIVINILL